MYKRERREKNREGEKEREKKRKEMLYSCYLLNHSGNPNL